MKTAYIFCLTLVATALLPIGCKSNASSPTSSDSKNIPEITKQYYREIRWGLPEDSFAKHAYQLDRYAFLRLHREEMLKTLEVVDTSQTDNIAVAFIRYSIGSTVYRDAVWMRKVDGRWLVCWKQYFSDYGDDPFGDGKPDAAKAVIKRVNEWEQESPKEWWE